MQLCVYVCGRTEEETYLNDSIFKRNNKYENIAVRKSNFESINYYTMCTVSGYIHKYKPSDFGYASSHLLSACLIHVRIASKPADFPLTRWETPLVFRKLL